ncbi:PREDICTED: G-protein coupled receptor 35 [Elephantulus edwardii]|uniref:G-protein coupled receptor 35 n=1 Tax=Elephantulus edwardii TaxID=28737 RepID=UPI0003F097A5|nr:PREDICTED: G-protein coupled receptor 35 [Elephantulus edwardii]
MNISCNFSQKFWPPSVTYLSMAYTGLMLVAGLLLNAVALWVLCCRLPRWTETRIYMVNLAAADLWLLCALPFVLHTLKTETQDALFCSFSQGIYLLNRYMSISLITAIAVDRYLAVRHPLCARGLRSPRQAVAVCALLWVLVGGSLVVRSLLGMQENRGCFFGQSSNHMVIFSLLGFYLPMPVLVFCSLQVVTGLAQRPAADSAQVEATQKATRMVWANLVVFIVCFLPLHLVLTVFLAMNPPTCSQYQAIITSSIHFTSMLSNSNCCLDAICYYYMAKEFQEARVANPRVKAHKSQTSLSMTLT